MKVCLFSALVGLETYNKISKCGGHKNVLVGNLHSDFILYFFDETHDIHGSGTSGEKICVVSNLDLKDLIPNLPHLGGHSFFFLGELNLHLIFHRLTILIGLNKLSLHTQ